MSLIPYALSKAFLFKLDAEQAHDLTIETLAKTQHTPLSLAYREPFINDPVEIAGLKFPNRVGLAAGLDKNAKAIDGLGAFGFGFIEVGTVTPKAQAGNPKPRIFRIPKASALINRLGFNNGGLDVFIANVQKSEFRKKGRILGLNIGKNATTPIELAANDYLTALNGVYPHADYVTINISSPNTQNLRALQNDKALEALLQAISQQREVLTQAHGRRVPIFVKIAPDLDDVQIKFIADTLVRCNMDGVIATNTTLSRDRVQGMPNADEAGGLSGAPVLEASNRVISLLRQTLDKAYGTGFPIIGVGGILSADDAVSKMKAGASAVQIYTGLIYRGAQLVTQSAKAIKNASF
jgi:dihydroorotate dehydrogenase